MAEESLLDRFFLQNAHEQRFTISNVDVTGRVMKWGLSALLPDGTFSTTPDVQLTTTAQPAQFVTQSASASESVVDVTINPSDIPQASLAPGNYHFQLEVFDASGDNGVVVAAGTATLVANLVEV